MPRASANRRSVGPLKIRPRKGGGSSVQARQWATQPVEKSHKRRKSDSFECNRGAHQTQRSKPQMGSFFGNPTSPYLLYYKRLTCYHPQKMHNPIPPCFPHIFAQPKGSQLLRGVFDARRLTWNPQNQRCKGLSLNGLRRLFDFVKKNTNLRFRSVDTPLRLR